MKKIANIDLINYNKYHIRTITKVTFTIPATESIRELTRILIDGFLDMNLKG